MKKSDTHAFVNQLLICLLVTISCGGSIGLGTVWMRHQNSVTAAGNRALVAEIDRIERQLADTTVQIESEQNLDILRQRNQEWRLGYEPLQENRTVRMAGYPVERLRARANREFFDAAARSAGVRVALAR